MLSDDRLRWLLGDERPTWSVPAGLYDGEFLELDALTEDDHTPLAELEPADDAHSEELASLDNRTFRYLDAAGHGHLFVVSSAGPVSADLHVASTAVWARAVPEGGPRPVHLGEVLRDAAQEIGEARLPELLGEFGAHPPPTMHLLLSAGAPQAVPHAHERTAAALDRLRDTGVITEDDRAALNPQALLAPLLEQPPAEFVAADAEHRAAALHGQPGDVSMSTAAENPVHGQLFSIRAGGGTYIGRGRRRGFGSKYPKKTRVFVRAGRVRAYGAVSGSLRRRRSATSRWPGYVMLYGYQRSSVVVSGVG